MVSEKIIIVLIIVAIVLSVVSIVVTLSTLNTRLIPEPTVVGGRDTQGGQVSITINPYRGELNS